MVGVVRSSVSLMMLLAVSYCNEAFGVVPLTVKCRCERADTNRTPGEQNGTLWTFVLDHSGTMAAKDAHSVKRGSLCVSRWTALTDGFEETMKSIPFGSRVQVYCVGGVKSRGLWSSGGWRSSEAKRIYQDPVLIRSQSDRMSILSDIVKWGEPTGGTPLYDALYYACEDVQNYARSGGNSCIVVFSDGHDESHSSDCKTLDDIRRNFARGTSNSVGLFAADEFDACLTWIGKSTESPVAVFGEKYLWAKTHEIPFVCLVSPVTRTYNHRSPLETNGRAEVSDLTYLFPMSSERWQSMIKRATVKPALEVSTVDGAVLGSCVLDLAHASEATFQLPDSVFSDDKATTLKLSLQLPAKDGACRFSRTQPVYVMFDRVGKVSIAAVRPAGDIYIARGSTVEFSAEASSGAEFAWGFGDGATAKGDKVTHTYDKINESGYPYSLTVRHGKMAPDTRTGRVYVVDAGVAFVDLPKNATEGVECSLSCKAWRDVSSVTWYVDGVCYRGVEQKAGKDTISVLRHTFDASREYKIQVRANIQRIGECRTEEVGIKVGSRPYVRIVAPEAANEKFDVDDDIDFAARVSGIASGKWFFKDAAGKVVKELVASVSDDKPVSVAKLSFADGGDFTAVFVGKTAVGSEVASAEVPFRVNPRVVRIEIASPTADEEIKTDIPFKLCAKNVKGVSGELQWVLLDENQGNEKLLGGSGVSADGTSEKVMNFRSAEYGEGPCFLVARSADRKASSKPMPITLRSQAKISIVEPVNGQTVEFDGSIKFAAKVESEGDVLKSDAVRWVVQRVGGAPENAGTKVACSHQFKRIPNASSVSYTVHAEATLPSGRIVQSEDERTVIAFCPAIRAQVVQPLVNGVVLASIGKQVDYTVSLRTADGESLSDVVWEMGDGVSYTNLTSVKHAYKEYGTYQIKVSGRCAKCGDAFALNAPARLVVEKQPISAAFVIRPSANSPKTISGTIAQGRQVTLVGMDSPDIAKREWTCNGLPIFGDNGLRKDGAAIEYRCKDVGDYVFSLTVYDDVGNAVGPETHSLRAYRLWAVLLISFVALVVWLMLVWYWRGDDPRFWTLLVRIDENRDTSFAELKKLKLRPPKVNMVDYWNKALNKAKISMRELTRSLRSAGEWKKSGMGDGEITIEAVRKDGKDRAVVQKLSGNFEVAPEDGTDGVFRIVSESPEDLPIVLEVKRNVGDKTHVLYMALSFVLISLLAAGLCAWLAF